MHVKTLGGALKKLDDRSAPINFIGYEKELKAIVLLIHHRVKLTS